MFFRAYILIRNKMNKMTRSFIVIKVVILPLSENHYQETESETWYHTIEINWCICSKTCYPTQQNWQKITFIDTLQHQSSQNT